VAGITKGRKYYIYKTDCRASRKWILYTANCLLIAKLCNRETRLSILDSFQTRSTVFGKLCRRNFRACRKWIQYTAKCLYKRDLCNRKTQKLYLNRHTRKLYLDRRVSAIYNNIYRTDVRALRKWIRYTAKWLYKRDLCNRETQKLYLGRHLQYILVQYSIVQDSADPANARRKNLDLMFKCNLESIDVRMQSRIDGFVNKKPDMSIGYLGTGYQKDRNRMGSEDLVERRIGLFQSEQELEEWRDLRQRI
jgi:hypothetical protein